MSRCCLQSNGNISHHFNTWFTKSRFVITIFLNRRIHYLSAASTVMSPLRKGKPEVTAHTGGCLTVRDPHRGHMPHPRGIKPCSLGLFCWCIGFGCRIRIYSTSHWNYIPIHMCISKPCFTITCTSLALYVEKSLKLNYHKLTKNVFILPSQIYIHKLYSHCDANQRLNDWTTKQLITRQINIIIVILWLLGTHNLQYLQLESLIKF